MSDQLPDMAAAAAAGAPVRLYLWTPRGEPIRTIRGRELWGAWCERQVERLRAAGRKAFLVEGARNGNSHVLSVAVDKPEGLRNVCSRPDCILERKAMGLCEKHLKGEWEKVAE